MTPEKLKSNLKKLRAAIVRKPAKYTSEYAITAHDSFSKYTRTSTVNAILSINEMLFEFNWPFTAYFLGSRWAPLKFALAYLPVVLMQKVRNILNVLTSKPKNNILTTSSGEISKELTENIDKLMVRLFLLHEREVFSYWKASHILQGKRYIIDNIRSCYKRRLWYACIAAAFPILDFLCRKYVNSNHLDQDIQRIVSCFKEAGILSRNLKPGYIAWDVSAQEGELTTEATQKDLRLVGVLLGSFLDFASIYYAWYRKDASIEDINRHAIIHCASQHLWTRENATKVLVFIDLTLRLEPAFKILLKED